MISADCNDRDSAISGGAMALLLLILACSGESGTDDSSALAGESDADTDSDSDSDSDTDSDTDTDADTDADTDSDTDTDAEPVDWKGEYELPEDGITLAGDRDGDSAGEGLATGDFDGDGQSDIAAASPTRGGGGSQALGLVSVVRGPITKDGELEDAWLTISGEDPWGWFGVNISAVPDLDGDGVEDLLVAQPFTEAGVSSSNEGPAMVRLFLGLAAGSLVADDADYTYTAEGTTDQAGWGLGTGDFDGDGTADLVIGAPFNDSFATDAGVVYIVAGAALDTPDLADAPTRIYGDLAKSGYQPNFGASVSDLGDLDGDGVSDLAVASPRASTDSGAGIVSIFHGPLSGAMLASDADASIESATNPALLGLIQGSVAPAGDVDGDGTTDVLVGAYAERPLSNEEGCAYLVDGTQLSDGTFSLLLSDWKLQGVTAEEAVGYQVGSAGDADADGYADVLVSAPHNDDWGRWSGAVYYFRGPLSGADEPKDQRASFHGVTFDRLGFVLPEPADVTGDDHLDLVFGAPSLPSEGNGAVYIVPGMAL
jgi:hypothetical protein